MPSLPRSRPQTPGPGSGAATPTKGGPLAAAAAAAANAETPRQRGSKIELASQVAINVDDLLDFWCVAPLLHLPLDDLDPADSPPLASQIFLAARSLYPVACSRCRLVVVPAL